MTKNERLDNFVIALQADVNRHNICEISSNNNNLFGTLIFDFFNTSKFIKCIYRNDEYDVKVYKYCSLAIKVFDYKNKDKKIFLCS